MTRASHLDNQQNIHRGSLRDKDSFLSGTKLQRQGITQLTYSTLKPMRVIHGGLHDPDPPNRTSFQKKGLYEAADMIQREQDRLHLSREELSRSSERMLPGDYAPRAPNSRLTLRQHLQELQQQLEQPANPSQMVRYRASSRLLNMISKVLNDPQEDSVTLTTHTSSLQMLIDRYEFELDEKTREITMLKDRLQRKELELCKLERRLMDGIAEKAQDRVCECLRLRESSGSSGSVMSPIVSRTTFSLDTAFENKYAHGISSYVSMRGQSGNPADSFIKVCDGASSIQHRIPTGNTVHEQPNQPQFVVDLRAKQSCLFDHSFTDEEHIFQFEDEQPKPSIISLPHQEVIEQQSISKDRAEQVLNVTINQCKTTETTLSNIKNIKPQYLECSIQTNQEQKIDKFAQETQTDQEPILVIELPEPKQPEHFESAPVTVQNSRKIVDSFVQGITERQWIEDQIYSARTVKRQDKRLFEQVLSVSISHSTIKNKSSNRLKHFKTLVKTTTDIINSTWKLILQLRKKNKENRDAAANNVQPSLKPTKQNLEVFAVWFNEKYVNYLEDPKNKPPEEFYTDTLGRVKEYSASIIDMAEKLCC